MNVGIEQRHDGVAVGARDYALWLPAGRPYVHVTDADGTPWIDLFIPSSLHTAHGLDDTTRLHAPQVECTARGYRITIDSESTIWSSKRTVLDCAPDELRVTVDVAGAGPLADVHLLGGYYSGDLRHGSGFHQSGIAFGSVCNPEPWGSERRVLSAAESTVLDVLGTSVPGKRHWQFTPPPLCLAVNREAPPSAPTELPAGPWMTIGLGATRGQHNFTALHYDAVEGACSLRLAYEGQTLVDGRFTTPSVRFRFGAGDPYAGFADHADSLRAERLAPSAATRSRPQWWTRPIFSGWGAQCLIAAGADGGPQDYAAEQHYDGFLAALAAHELDPGTVVIDDKWQRAYGSWEADPAKWPDLRSWIARRHAVGQRVLLWWKAWDPEGLPTAWCVRNRRGLSLGVDPSHPEYEAALRASVERMLGDGGFGADGLKIDFSARTPSGPGLVHHGAAWGMELLHRLLEIIYDQAKRTKTDALIMTHAPHPYFADVSDMIRLNDVNIGAPVVAQMVHRAKVAAAACPQLLIDTDNWPMPDPASFRSYVAAQPALGVPSLYYATHLDDEDGPVAMTADDYRLIRTTWERASTDHAH